MSREFSVNHPLLFILAGAAVLVVIVQSVVFLIKAWRHALELGYSKDKLKKLAVSAAIFSIPPAIGVGIGIITLAGTLGLPLPWLRLSVVGAIMYELSAATTAAQAMGVELGSALNAVQFSNIAWIMTIGICTGLVLIPVFCRKTLDKFNSVGSGDKAWAGIFTDAIFMGLIATFVGLGVGEVRESGEGIVKALVLVVSALVMVLCGLGRKKLGWKWMNDYALPICMILSMAAAIPLTAWIC